MTKKEVSYCFYWYYLYADTTCKVVEFYQCDTAFVRMITTGNWDKDREESEKEALEMISRNFPERKVIHMSYAAERNFYTLPYFLDGEEKSWDCSVIGYDDEQILEELKEAFDIDVITSRRNYGKTVVVDWKMLKLEKTDFA